MFSGINVSVWRPFGINTLVQHDLRRHVLISTTSCVCQSVRKIFSPFSYQQCDWLELHPNTPTPSVTSQKDRSPVGLPAVLLFCSFVSLSLCLFMARLCLSQAHRDTQSLTRTVHFHKTPSHIPLLWHRSPEAVIFSARWRACVYTNVGVKLSYVLDYTGSRVGLSARDVHYQMAILVLDLRWHHMLRV